LIELLVVLAIIALVSAIAAPTFMGLNSSGRMNENLLEVRGLLEEARQYAIAQNTYVWVAFLPSTSTTTGMATLSVAILASKDGTDPAGPLSWADYSYGTVPNSEIGLISKITTLQQISLLSNVGNFTSQIVSLPSTSTIGGLAVNNNGFFNLQSPGTSTPQVFTEALQFTPSGEARNLPTPVSLVELDLQLQKGSVLDAHNVAVIRVNGLTGESITYRP